MWIHQCSLLECVLLKVVAQTFPLLNPRDQSVNIHCQDHSHSPQPETASTDPDLVVRSNVVLVTDGQDRVLQFRAQEAGFNTIPLLLLEVELIRMLLVLFAGIRTLSSVPGYNRYGMYV